MKSIDNSVLSDIPGTTFEKFKWAFLYRHMRDIHLVVFLFGSDHTEKSILPKLLKA